MPGERFGAAVAPAGDVDGDGFDDVLVAAPEAAEARGRVQLHRGGPDGLELEPSWSLTGGDAGERLGAAVAPAGDVDGDGYDDVLLGSPGWSSDRGRARLVRGSALGLAPAPSWTAVGDAAGDRLGSHVAPAGDVDGDGHDDALIGAAGFASGAGRAILHRGEPGGLSALPAWVAVGDVPGAEAAVVAPAGDVDGDGHPDVLVGAPGRDAERGRVSVHAGSPSGLTADPTLVIDGAEPGGRLGQALGIAGDLDGDGHADVAIGVPGSSARALRAGQVRLHRGGAAGLGETADATLDGEVPDGALGRALMTAADVDGDGHADIVVGATGRARLFMGSPGTLPSVASWSEGGDDDFGASVALAGDVNGDGRSDVVVGAPGDDATDSGSVLVFHGSTRAMGSQPTSLLAPGSPWSDEGQRAWAAGDLNGDGHSDVAMLSRAPWSTWLPLDGPGDLEVFLGGPGGLSPAPALLVRVRNGIRAAAAGAGDVNGDGYDDLLVADGGGGLALYPGAPSGPASTPAWIGDVSGSELFGAPPLLVGLGDVNCDGFGDFAVGQSGAFGAAGHSAGRVLAWYGSETWPRRDPDWAREGRAMHQRYGGGLGAGDVNGDGFADLVASGGGIGGLTLSFYSSVELFLGQGSGLRAEPVWSVEYDAAAGGISGDWWNHHVGAFASLGDVDGDGFADLATTGRSGSELRIYRGSPSGPASSPDQAFMAEAKLGTFGDFNGDGRSDLVSSDDARPRRVHVRLGSDGGLEEVPSWSREHYWSRPIIGAGDVDADGFDDVFSLAVERLAMTRPRGEIFSGSGVAGRERPRAQWRADGTAPLQEDGIATMAEGLRLRLDAFSPFGRDGVRLEWQLDAPPATFDGPVRAGAWRGTGAPGARGSRASLDELVAPLPGAGPRAWRLRCASRFPLPWRSPWLSAPGGIRSDARLRTPCRTAQSAGAAGPTSCREAALRGWVASDVDEVVDWQWTSSRSDVTVWPGAGSVAAGAEAVELPPARVRLDAATPPCGVRALLSLEVAGASVAASAAEVGIMFDDSESPRAEAGSGDLACAWPPNGGWACFDARELRPEIRDDCGATWVITACEPASADAGAAEDCRVADDGGSACVRARRPGTATDGARFAIVGHAIDACGRVSAPVVAGFVLVPHDAAAHPSCRRPVIAATAGR